MFRHQDNQATNEQPTTVPPADNSLSDSSTATVVDPPGAPPADWPEPTVTHGQMLPPTHQPPSSDEDVASAEPAQPKPEATKAKPVAEESGDLLEIKQNALLQLSPLVSHLDQSPEEKFRTLMMMIQASDDQSL